MTKTDSTDNNSRINSSSLALHTDTTMWKHNVSCVLYFKRSTQALSSFSPHLSQISQYYSDGFQHTWALSKIQLSIKSWVQLNSQRKWQSRGQRDNVHMCVREKKRWMSLRKGAQSRKSTRKKREGKRGSDYEICGNKGLRVGAHIHY